MLSSNQINTFNKDGYLVIEDFINQKQRKLLMDRAEKLIDDFQPPSSHSVFTTDEQERTSDEYFLSSGDQIRFFLKRRQLMKMEILLFLNKNQLIKLGMLSMS